MALSTFKPSRELYKDFSTEAGIYNQTLGNANLSPIMDAVQGINAGLTLADNIQSTWNNIGPDGVERRRLEMEEARTRAETEKHALTIKAIEAKHKAILDETILLDKQTKLQESTLEHQWGGEKLRVLSKAYSGMGQIQDAASLYAYLSNPEFAILYGDEKFGNLVRARSADLIRTASPEDQINLIQIAEAFKPGSGQQIISVSPPSIAESLGKQPASGGTSKTPSYTERVAREGMETKLATAVQIIHSKIPQDENGNPTARVTVDGVNRTMTIYDPLNPGKVLDTIKLNALGIDPDKDSVAYAHLYRMVAEEFATEAPKSPVQSKTTTTEDKLKASSNLGAGGTGFTGPSVIKKRLGITDSSLDDVLPRIELLAKVSPSFGAQEEAVVKNTLLQKLSTSSIANDPILIKATIESIMEELRNYRKEIKNREKAVNANRTTIPIAGVGISPTSSSAASPGSMGASTSNPLVGNNIMGIVN